MVIFILLLTYILPIVLSIVFMIISYKLLYKDQIPIGQIYDYYYNSDTFIERSEFPREITHYLTTSLFAPIFNIFLMFYFMILSIYNYIKDIKI